jgi:hypothetical protein
MNNPLRYIDPSGHDSEENCPDGQCQDDTDELIQTIESTYYVDVGEGWEYIKLLLLLEALNNMAAAVGGVDVLNASFQQASSQPIGFVQGAYVDTNDPNKDYSKQAATHIVENSTVYLPDFIFSKEYNDAIGEVRRPSSLGLDDYNLSIQATMAHEMSHIYVKANPGALTEYILNVNNKYAFNPTPGSNVRNSSEESMASAIAIYAVGGPGYPGYQDQMDTMYYIFSNSPIR